MIFVLGLVVIVGLIVAVNYSLVRRDFKKSQQLQAALYQDLDLSTPPNSVE